MHILFHWAMKWELIDLDKMNPMKLVHVEGSCKRLRQPRALTVKEFRLLLERLEEPIRTMCIVAACLGLRGSELAGLQWGDFDWGGRQVHIQRGFVIGYVDEVKTPTQTGVCLCIARWQLSFSNIRRKPQHTRRTPIGFSRVPTGPGGRDGRGRSSELTCSLPEFAPDLGGLDGTRFGILTRPCCTPCEWI